MCVIKKAKKKKKPVEKKTRTNRNMCAIRILDSTLLGAKEVRFLLCTLTATLIVCCRWLA